jgi:hypothetical protein
MKSDAEIIFLARGNTLRDRHWGLLVLRGVVLFFLGHLGNRVALQTETAERRRGAFL